MVPGSSLAASYLTLSRVNPGAAPPTASPPATCTPSKRSSRVYYRPRLGEHARRLGHALGALPFGDAAPPRGPALGAGR